MISLGSSIVRLTMEHLLSAMYTESSPHSMTPWDSYCHSQLVQRCWYRSCGIISGNGMTSSSQRTCSGTGILGKVGSQVCIRLPCQDVTSQLTWTRQELPEIYMFSATPQRKPTAQWRICGLKIPKLMSKSLSSWPDPESPPRNSNLC